MTHSDTVTDLMSRPGHSGLYCIVYWYYHIFCNILEVWLFLRGLFILILQLISFDCLVFSILNLRLLKSSSRESRAVVFWQLYVLSLVRVNAQWLPIHTVFRESRECKNYEIRVLWNPCFCCEKVSYCLSKLEKGGLACVSVQPFRSICDIINTL